MSHPIPGPYNVAVQYHRLANAQKAQDAAVGVSQKAHTVAAQLLGLGVALHVRQLSPDQSRLEMPAEKDAIQPTNVVLVSFEKGERVLQKKACLNEIGPDAPHATLNAMLEAVTKKDITKWKA